MKILNVVSFKVGASGPTSVLIPIIKRLIKKGHSIDVFSPFQFNKDRHSVLNSLGSRYFYKKRKTYITKSELLDVVRDLKSYDVVHIHGVFNLNNIIIANLLYKMKIPYIVSTHGNLMEEALKHSKFKKKIAIELLIKKMLNRSSTIHVLVKEEKESIEKLVKNKNINLIHNGVEIIKRTNTANSTFDKKNSNDILNILYIGRIDKRHKGIDLLIEAIEKRIDSWKGKVRLYLVGPFDTKEDEYYINNKLNNTPLLKDIIKVEGPQFGSAKEKYYDLCDLFIHTSRYEGMPMAVLEAMQMGLPCIVTPGTNMANIMKESGGGIVVEPNVNSIIEGIDNIMKLKKLDLMKMGKNSHYWCNKNLNWDIIADQYEEMYELVKKGK